MVETIRQRRLLDPESRRLRPAKPAPRFSWDALVSPTLLASVVLVTISALTILGLMVLYSASRAMHDDATYLLLRQVIWLGVALIGLGFFSFFPLRWWSRLWPLVIGGSFLGLILVLVPAIGIEVNGARRWIGLGPLRFQPSEFAKFGLILLLAHYLHLNRREIVTFWRGFVFPAAGIGFFCLLIMKQPDFGTAFLCAAVAGTILFVAGTRISYLVVAGVAAVSLFAIMVYLDPVRWERIVAFLDFEANRSGSSYQLAQGIVAFGVGGWFGVGPGSGRQQMAFLPEAHTDFIFAIMGEELGLVITGTVVLLFIVLFLVGWSALRRAPDLFQYLLVLGAILFIAYQAIINVGVVTGSMPTKGMSLPFISYGGSNLVFVYAMVGLLLNALRTWEGPVRSRSSEIAR